MDFRWCWPPPVYLMFSVRLCSGISYCRLRKIDLFALAASSLKWPYLLLFLLSPLVLLLRYGSIDYVEHWRSYKLWRLRKTFLLLAIQVSHSRCRIGYYSRCYFSSLFVFDLTLIIWKVIRRDQYNGFHFQSQQHLAQWKQQASLFFIHEYG